MQPDHFEFVQFDSKVLNFAVRRVFKKRSLDCLLHKAVVNFVLAPNSSTREATDGASFVLGPNTKCPFTVSKFVKFTALKETGVFPLILWEFVATASSITGCKHDLRRVASFEILLGYRDLFVNPQSA